MREIRQFSTLPPELRDAISAGTTRALCPKCAGGSSRELSLSVRRMFETDTLIKLSCFRATCDWYCTVATGSDVRVQTSPMKQATPYTRDILPLSKGMETFLDATFGLRAAAYRAHGWGMTDKYGNALVLPILDPYGRGRGHITRSFEAVKQVYTYKATARPFLDWWRNDADAPTVIVEDCLSACRLAGLGYNAVALLGTGINVEQAQEINTHAPGFVYLALDRDAWQKSLKLAQRHSHILKMLPICLTKDVKNIDSDDEIVALFGGASNG